MNLEQRIGRRERYEGEALVRQRLMLLDYTSNDDAYISGANDAAGGGVLSSQAATTGAIMAGSGSPTSFGTSLLNFFGNVAPSIIKATTGPSPSTGLQSKLNPATGTYQLFNPATGTFLPSTSTTGLSSLFSGNGLLLVVVALVVAFFAFGGRKRLHSVTA